ncbi:MAG: AsmA family protein [Elusimicrobiaceae bacterium]|nr:AsmA family protein [Elusimicrobiaceae bacterium]
MIKKLLKWLFICAAVGVLLIAAGVFTLYKTYPPAKLKTMAQAYVAQNFQREIVFEDISFTWIGFTLKNFALSENTTLADGTFIRAKQLTAHVAVKPLLHKRIEISKIEADGLQINIIQNKDGSFNFDTLLTEDNSTTGTTATQADSADEFVPFVLTADQIILKDCDIIYQDQQTGMRLALNALNIEIKQFDLQHPFETIISFTTDISGTGQPDMRVPVTIRVTTDLADLDLPGASATITEISARYKTILLQLQGDIKNFQAPQVNLTGTLSGIDNAVLREFAPDLPNFTLPLIHMALQANADLDTNTARISQAKLSVKNSALSTNGQVSWGGNSPTYSLAGSLQANITELVQMTDTMDDFQPTGVIKGTFKATEKKNFTDVSGAITLQDISALYPPVTLTKTNGTIVITSLENISVSSLTGKLNGEDFTASGSYKSVSDVMNIVLKLNLNKLVLDSFPTTQETASESTAAQTSADATSHTAAASPRMNIQANVNVGGIKIPYLQSDGFVLTANLTDVTDTMSQTNGNIEFALKPGQITNLDNFVKDSKIAKIILLPVTLVKKVAGFLKLDLFPADTTGNGATIAFTQAEGTYTFTNGVMNIEKTVFNSTVTNISASGSANFKTEALNMKATATLLTQAAPLAFKITGTLSNPSGKLDVVNTVTSVVGGLLNGTAVKSAANESTELTKQAATTAADTVKETVNTAANVVKGIGSLFKKNNSQDK